MRSGTHASRKRNTTDTAQCVYLLPSVRQCRQYDIVCGQWASMVTENCLTVSHTAARTNVNLLPCRTPLRDLQQKRQLKVEIAMHCNLSPPDVAPIVSGYFWPNFHCACE